MHYNYHRYYDPATGRYLTPDPIGLAGGINPFVYVLNDPVNKIDPLGLFGFAFDGGGGYGQGEAGGDDPEGKNYGTGIYGGVKPNSQGHAQIGAFTYQSDADQMIFAPRFGGGVNGTVYYGDAKDFFSGTMNYTGINFIAGSLTIYKDPCTGETSGFTVSLFGRGIGLGIETGTTDSQNYPLQN